MTVRLAGADDAHRLADLAAATFPLACPPGTRTEDIAEFISNVLSTRHFESYVTDPSRVVLIDEDQGQPPVGYVMLVAGEPADRKIAAALTLFPTLELSKFYVEPSAHGNGASSRLMSAALAHARRSGCAGMWLGVNQHNHRAQSFYTKHGFRDVGTKTFVVGAQTHDDYIMQVQLTD